MIWITPEAEQLVGYLAKVSNPSASQEDDHSKLIGYLIKHKHWSPFEMVSACIEINTTRDITHQLIRHRSFSFQEFSGRYAAYDKLVADRECRLQDTKNRQNSLECNDDLLIEEWGNDVKWFAEEALSTYHHYLKQGVAKEVARSILPEGLVPSKVYMAGTLRSWIHYFQVRCTPETQKEHRDVAEAARKVLFDSLPTIASAVLQQEAPQ